jgi:hypothetical protein
MNSSPSLRLLLVFAGAVALAGCASSPMSRIDANRAAYESWPFEVQEAVLNGQAKPGMTPEQVRVALGKPTEVVQRSVQSGDDEVWVYRKSGDGGGAGSILQTTGISIGAGTGGIGVSTDTNVPIGGGNVGPTGEEREVVFQNGVVVRSDF